MLRGGKGKNTAVFQMLNDNIVSILNCANVLIYNNVHV